MFIGLECIVCGICTALEVGSLKLISKGILSFNNAHACNNTYGHATVSTGSSQYEPRFDGSYGYSYTLLSKVPFAHVNYSNIELSTLSKAH